MTWASGWLAPAVALLLVTASAPAAPAAPDGPLTLPLSQVGFRLATAVEGDMAGYGIAVGDFDGDGVADLAVGAGCDPANGPGAGAAYVLYGPITPDRSLADADVILQGTTPGDYFGEFLAAMDLDGDGADELVIGAPGPIIGAGPAIGQCFLSFVQPGLNRPGSAYVFRGGERRSGLLQADEAADTVVTGPAPADFTGFHVGGADLDGDGKDELVVGAVGLAGTTGGAFVFSGSEDLPPTAGGLDADAVLIGERPLGLFGYHIVSGDVDGDGTDDLLVAAPALAVHPGIVSVFLGGAVPSGVVLAASADLRLEGSGGDGAGGGLTVADLDGDGVADVVAGAQWSDRSYVLYGPLEQRGTLSLEDADVRITAGQSRRAGAAVAVGNLDGKDRSDLFIGAPADAIGGPHAGAVHRLQGRLHDDVDATAQGFLLVGQAGEEAGTALAVGDVTGDGFDDLIVGAPAFDQVAAGGGPPGAVYVVPGGRSQDETGKGKAGQHRGGPFNRGEPPRRSPPCRPHHAGASDRDGTAPTRPAETCSRSRS